MREDAFMFAYFAVCFVLIETESHCRLGWPQTWKTHPTASASQSSGMKGTDHHVQLFARFLRQELM